MSYDYGVTLATDVQLGADEDDHRTYPEVCAEPQLEMAENKPTDTVQFELA